jgi:hypothetical protein
MSGGMGPLGSAVVHKTRGVVAREGTFVAGGAVGHGSMHWKDRDESGETSAFASASSFGSSTAASDAPSPIRSANASLVDPST